MSIRSFKGQDYNELKDQYDSDNLFEDPEFPANGSSIYHTQQFASQLSRSFPRGISWRRPTQVIDNAEFVVNGFGRCDMDQGALGNCWFIAGCVGIMQSESLFAKVVPPDQNFTDTYNGMFHFRFWQYGEWVDVVIDDRLPYSNGKLIFSRNSEQENEFWAPLLEKAFAKLNGNYETLEAGLTVDALIDMSGGVREEFDLQKLDNSMRYSLWKIMYQAYRKQSIMGCSITADSRVREARMSNGLVRGHAYTITKLAVVSSHGRDVQLIRIRNPWGNEVEWKGAWSDKSSEWHSVSEEEREEIGLNFDRDGEFWMSYRDFLEQWSSLEICHLSVDSFSDEQQDAENNLSWKDLCSDSGWKCTIYSDKWAVGRNAGGCGNGNMAKFWTNPQYMITLNDVDKDDEENKATCVIALMQKDARLKRVKYKSDDSTEYIQFKLFKIKDGVSIDENVSSGLRFYSNQLIRIGDSGSYINSREVTKRFKVDPGNYLIIPSTYHEDRNCEFVLRIFTEQEIDSNTLEEEKDDINEDDTFFELGDTDEIFSSWDNLMGEPDQSQEEPEEQTEESYQQEKGYHMRPMKNEQCSLM